MLKGITMNNLITIENQNAVVTMVTISNFAGIKYESIRDTVSKRKDKFEKLGMDVSVFGSGKQADLKSVSFNERQVTFLLTLLKNTEVVEEFKFSLVEQFFKMRDEIQSIKIEAVKDVMLEDKQRAVAEAKKMNTYTVNGLDMITVGKYAKEYSELSPSFVWDALEAKGLVNTETRLTKFRRLPQDVESYKASTISGKSTPIYLKQVIDDAIATYQPIEDCQEDE